FIVAENDGVTRDDVFRAVVFNHAKDFAAQKNASMRRHGVPTLRVKVIHTVGEVETETGRPVPLLVTIANTAQGLREVAEGIRGFEIARHRRLRGPASI